MEANLGRTELNWKASTKIFIWAEKVVDVHIVAAAQVGSFTLFGQNRRFCFDCQSLEDGWKAGKKNAKKPSRLLIDRLNGA